MVGNVSLGSRALVATDAVPSDTPGTLRPNAAYLAQLLAIEFDCPQTRMRRRATPSNAAAVYRRQASSDAKCCRHRLLRDL
jgi:hypothetical protein